MAQDGFSLLCAFLFAPAYCLFLSPIFFLYLFTDSERTVFHMAATLTRYIIEKYPTDFLEEIQKSNLDSTYYHENQVWNGWEGLEDIVEELDIDTEVFSTPDEFYWTDAGAMAAGARSAVFAETFVAETRDLPDFEAGNMFVLARSTGEVKSARDITWAELLDDLAVDCHDCEFMGYYSRGDGVFVLNENGDTAVWELGALGLCALDIPDDYGLITGWNEDKPKSCISCPNFRWNW